MMNYSTKQLAFPLLMIVFLISGYNCSQSATFLTDSDHLEQETDLLENSKSLEEEKTAPFDKTNGTVWVGNSVPDSGTKPWETDKVTVTYSRFTKEGVYIYFPSLIQEQHYNDSLNVWIMQTGTEKQFQFLRGELSVDQTPFLVVAEDIQSIAIEIQPNGGAYVGNPNHSDDIEPAWYPKAAWEETKTNSPVSGRPDTESDQQRDDYQDLTQPAL